MQAIKEHLTGLSPLYRRRTHRADADHCRARDVAAEQVVLGEILDVLGLYLSAHGGSGGEFDLFRTRLSALVDAVSPAGGIVVGVPSTISFRTISPPSPARSMDGRAQSISSIRTIRAVR